MIQSASDANTAPLLGPGVRGSEETGAHHPPYDLTADMLVAITFLPTRPLRRAFPRVPFLSVFGRTLAIIWFSQVTDGWYTGAQGQRRRLGDGHTPLYAELNVLASLWRRAIFVPGIYATSALSIRIAHRYGMPKQPIHMRFEASDAGRMTAEAMDGARTSAARARPLSSGRFLTPTATHILPRWSWPVRFPSGSAVRALLLSVAAVRLAHVTAGHVALSADWLPRRARLLPVGLAVSGLRMLLPPERSSAFEPGSASDGQRTRSARVPPVSPNGQASDDTR